MQQADKREGARECGRLGLCSRRERKFRTFILRCRALASSCRSNNRTTTLDLG